MLRQKKMVMLWGAISYGRKYPLVKVDLSEGSLTGDRYRDEILRPHLAKHVAGLRKYGQRHVKVVEDGASVHSRKSTLTARRELRVSPKPPVLMFPAKSARHLGPSRMRVQRAVIRRHFREWSSWSSPPRNHRTTLRI